MGHYRRQSERCGASRIKQLRKLHRDLPNRQLGGAMAVSNEALRKIKAEILNDPQNIGYAGKTDQQVADLLNAPQVVDVVQQQIKPAPINRVLSGVANEPNICDAADVAAARSS